MNWDSDHGFSTVKLELKDDYEGRAEAVLVVRKAKRPSAKAFLYVHGFVDYFFHDKFADWANSIGYNFYAIDLRKYGRSWLPHQKPNNFKHYNEYFEDFDVAIKYIKETDNNTELVLYGHSTGGLLTALYANHRKDDAFITGLILNSPFFDFNSPKLQKAFIPMISAIGGVFPNLPSPEGLKEGYATSLHKDFEGEWDFNLDWKTLLQRSLDAQKANALGPGITSIQKPFQVSEVAYLGFDLVYFVL